MVIGSASLQLMNGTVAFKVKVKSCHRLTACQS